MSLAIVRNTALLLTLTLVGLACDEQDLEPSESSFRNGNAQTLPSDSGGMWVNNGLDDPSVSGIDPQFSLDSQHGLSTTHGILLDPSRHDTVRYLVECALPAGHSIHKQVAGQPLVFNGAIGLAPEWEDDGCDGDCQEWVSACLLARTNVSGKTVKIWLRADHPAIGEGTNLLYSTYEASFFGNLFANPVSRNFCQGTVSGPLLGQLEGRTCAGLVGPSCGFTKHTACAVEPRCTFPALDALGLPTSDHSPKNCIVGPVVDGNGDTHHTISTYVGAL